jgi:signal peptidase II
VNRRNAVFLAVAILGIALDQLTKWWIVTHLDPHVGAIDVIPGFFQIVHAQNPGAAFGFMRDNQYRHELFLAFTAVACVVILDLFRRLPKDEVFMSITLGLIFSGALGNGIDRVRQHYVTDFLRFYTENSSARAWLASYHLPAEYPSFNVADSALVVGVGLFLVHYMFLEEKEPPVAPPPPTVEPVELAKDPAEAPTTPTS